MTENRHYIKFMSDIIDSGLWGRLSSSARALYPVLLKFSNQNFKPVWPGTDTLLGLTGFKTKKSIIQAKKELVEAGLLHFIPGTGRSSSQYFFAFNYKGSKITPQGDIPVYRRDGLPHPPEGDDGGSDGGIGVNPNNINITITNNQNIEKNNGELDNKQKLDFEAIIDDYGEEIFTEAYKIAKSRGHEKNSGYIRAICKNKIKDELIINNHKNEKSSDANASGEFRQTSWKGFLHWASEHLTASTVSRLRSINVEFDGKVILVKAGLNDLEKSVIAKYFQDESRSSVLVVFAEESSENRILT